MKENEFLDGVSNIDSDIVQRFVSMDNELQGKARRSKLLRLRLGSAAACFVLIIGTLITLPILQKDVPAPEPYDSESSPHAEDNDPYIPDGEPWSPTIDPNINEIVLSADTVGGIFNSTKDGAPTNQYTKVYSSDPEYLNLTPLPNTEYLPIYTTSGIYPTESSLKSFINQNIDAATAFFGVGSKAYEIERAEEYNENVISYEAEISESDGKIGIVFTARNNLLYISHYDLYSKRLKINGSDVSVNESDSDGQIKQKLQATISYICASFGVDYPDVGIYRHFRSNRLDYIMIYLYSQNDTAFPSSFSALPLTSGCIELTFSAGLGITEGEAFLSGVRLYQASDNEGGHYTVSAKGKMLSLEEAEQLLYRGYVFGGHSCPLCMAEQPEVDFTDYTYVNIEYVCDEYGKMYIPFYAFYKQIGKNDAGIVTYAKTYVPAVQVSGYEEYFESLEKDHKKGSDEVYVTE